MASLELAWKNGKQVRQVTTKEVNSSSQKQQFYLEKKKLEPGLEKKYYNFYF